MPKVLSLRDLVSRPENMDETVLSSLLFIEKMLLQKIITFFPTKNNNGFVIFTF